MYVCCNLLDGLFHPACFEYITVVVYCQVSTTVKIKSESPFPRTQREALSSCPSPTGAMKSHGPCLSGANSTRSVSARTVQRSPWSRTRFFPFWEIPFSWIVLPKSAIIFLSNVFRPDQQVSPTKDQLSSAKPTIVKIQQPGWVSE